VPTPDHAEIYRARAADYDRLVAREDWEGRILPALEAVVPLAGLAVVELGAGTGRVTRLVAARARFVWLFDASAPMLAVAAIRLRAAGLTNWRAAAADHRRLPLPGGVADLAVAGWSVGYLAVRAPAGWRQEVDRALAEVDRVLRPGGTAILLEALGTGVTEPEPLAELAGYYDHLAARGFARTQVRTDFRFADRAEAEELVPFFFGAEMAAKLVERDGAVTLPEWTGVWWRRRPAAR
jgi:ubiquinone/menaquinone biosynthesis C-methylase UbiE